MCIFSTLLISMHVYVIFSGKSRKTSIVFPNIYACFLKIGRLIGSELIQTKATKFKGQCDSVLTPA